MLSSFAAKEKLHMRRWGFVAAFLQGQLLDNEVVYCSMPSGYATGLGASNPSGADTVLRIEKPIYGMAQARRRLGGDGSRPSSPTSIARVLSPPSPTCACSPGAKPSRRRAARARRPN